MRFAASLALAQLRHHRRRWALLALGVALVIAVPVITAGLSERVGEQTVRRTIAGLSADDRTLLVSQELNARQQAGTPQQHDTIVRRELAKATPNPIVRQVRYRPLRVRGVLFTLGGVDDLSKSVRVSTGRLPRTCAPTRCEVVVLGTSTPALSTALNDLGVDVVGTVQTTDPRLENNGDSPLVLADGADAIGALKALELFGRYSTWAAAIDPDRVVARGVPGFVALNRSIEQSLDERVGSTTYARPDAQLQAAQRRADVSAERFGLLGGFAAVLLLGFAVVAAVGLRRESTLLQSTLRRRGATTAQVVAVLAIAAVVGTVLGAVVGTVGGAIAFGASALAKAAVTSALLTAASAAVVIVVLLWPDAQARAVWRLLDLVAVACLGAAVLAATRGTTDDIGGDPIVVALPVLASVVAGLVAARLWSPAARLAERLVARRSIAGRIALVGALRRPLRTVATVAFLTAAVAAVVFAGSYRATLLANDADQAAYRVPLDARVTSTDAGALPVLDPTSLGKSTHAYPVLRSSASITRLPGVVDAVPVLAVDADLLTRMHRWDRTTGADDDAATVAARLKTDLPGGAPTLPSGTRTIAVEASGVDAKNTAINLYLRTDTGRSITVALNPKGTALVGTVPSTGRLTAVALSVDESYDYATHHGHGIGEGASDRNLLAGRLVLGAMHADGAAVPWNWSSWGSTLGRASASATTLSLGYQINGAPVVAAPDYSQKHALSVPIVTDPSTATAARDRVLTFKLDAAVTVIGRIVATMPRLPTAGRTFVLADRAALAATVDLAAPGGNATEYWVSGKITNRTSYTVTYRQTIQDGLDADPIGRGARELLIIMAALALAVAAVALILLVVGERRDGAGELYAWEADGTRPAVLRRALAARAVAAIVVALPVGLVAGIVVARVGATLVAVDATGSRPTPPLEATLGSIWTVLVLLAGVGAGVVGALLVAARSLRERFPVLAEAELR